MDLLAQMGLGRGLLALLIIFVCLLLMLVILLQKGRGGGLAGAFGGGGGSNAFGAKTGDVFTWITVVVATVFVLLAIVGNFAFDQSALATVDTPTTAEPTTGGEDGTTITFPVDADTTGVTLEQVLPDGTVIPTPVEFELITEPIDEPEAGQEPSGDGSAAPGTGGPTTDKPTGAEPGESTPPKPVGDDPPSNEEGAPSGGDEGSSTP